MSNGLVLISIGLSDEKDLSLRALEEARRCDHLHLETYTTKLDTDADRLGRLIGKPVKQLSRINLEEHSEFLLDEASRSRVGILVGGDCLTATTHVSLLIEARRRGIPTEVIHGSSILTAVAETGLSIYKFGKTVTMPLPEKGIADAVLETLEGNMEQGLHTLILLDLDSEANKFVNINQAVETLLKSGKPEMFNPNTLVVGVTRLGSETQQIRADKAFNVSDIDFGAPPQALIIPAGLHFVEAEALIILYGCPEEAIKDRKIQSTSEKLIKKYVESCRRVLTNLKLKGLPRSVGEPEVNELVDHAERYLSDAIYYASEKRGTALSSVSYCEGILDAMRLLGLVEFEW